MGIRALAHRNYRLFFAGQIISVVGSWMQYTAQAWLVYRLTGSALLLGLVGFADKIPVFIFGLAGGLAADRFDRHRIVIVTQTLSMIQALILGVLVTAGHPQLWQIFALVISQGIVNAFDLPARQSFISSMVAPDDLPNALALNSSVFNASRVIGPALAGIMVATIGEGPCFLVNALSYMAVIICLMRMRFDSRRDIAPVTSTRDHLVAGLRFAAGSPPVRALLLLLGLVSACGMPYTVLMPMFAGDILHGGPRALGALMGSTGVGAFVAAVFLARRRSVRGLGRVVATGSIGFGASLILFAFSRSLIASCVVLFAVGLFMITQAAATNLLLQSLCPDALRGRIMSLYTIMFVGMTPFGSLVSGALAHRAGAPAAVAAGGALSAIAGVFFAMRISSMRRHVSYPIPESPIPVADGGESTGPR